MLIDNFFPRLKLIALPLATSLFFLTAPVASADNVFVKIEGIAGEVKYDGFEENIQALNWSWGLQQSASFDYGTGISRRKVNVQKLSFTHRLDRTTPALMSYCTSGKRISEVFLYLVRPGDYKQAYATIKLSDVIVSDISMGGANSPDPTMEEVSLSFAKIQISYAIMDERGLQKGNVQAGYEIMTDKTL